MWVRTSSERDFPARPLSRLDRERERERTQYPYERARSPVIGNDSLTPTGSSTTLRPESSLSGIFSRRRETFRDNNRILSFSRRDRDPELSRGESPTSTVISGTTANSYASSARPSSKTSKTHMGRSASVSVSPGSYVHTTDAQKRVTELEAELKSLKEKHASELAALLSALGDSQETVRELRARIKELEAREVNTKTRQTRPPLAVPASVPAPPVTVIPPAQSTTTGTRNHARKLSATSSVFQPVPDDVSLLVHERPTSMTAVANAEYEYEIGNETMDFNRSTSSSRPTSPTLVLPTLLTRQPSSQPQQISTSSSRTRSPDVDFAKTHEANSSISTTRSTLSEWQMQEGTSLKLRPEHAMFLEDVLDSSISA